MSYAEFIENILDARGRFACGDEYCERHHIIPKCMGGTNDEDNLIDLFAREHFEAHRLLALENPGINGLTNAWWAMCVQENQYTKERYRVSAEEYEEARKSYAVMMSKRMSGENNPNFGKTMSERQKKNMSEKLKGRFAGQNNPNYGNHKLSGENHWNYGKHLSNETKQKQSEKAKIRFLNPENHPNYGNHKLAGENNPNIHKVIRLSGLTIYNYLAQAAKENGMCRHTMTSRCKARNGFMYYDEWLVEQNN